MYWDLRSELRLDGINETSALGKCELKLPRRVVLARGKPPKQHPSRLSASHATSTISRSRCPCTRRSVIFPETSSCQDFGVIVSVKISQERAKRSCAVCIKGLASKRPPKRGKHELFAAIWAQSGGRLSQMATTKKCVKNRNTFINKKTTRSGTRTGCQRPVRSSAPCFAATF